MNNSGYTLTRKIDHTARHYLPIWSKRVVWVWALLAISADIKVTVYPHIHWAISAVAFVLLLPLLFRMKWRAYPQIFGAVWLFIFSLLLSGLRSPNPAYDAAQAIKLAIILFGALAFFLSESNYAHVAFRAFVFSVYLNLALLLLGMTFLPMLAGLMAPGRWGTFLNWPGSLWRAGIVVFFYAAYLAFTSGFRDVQNVVLLFASLLLIYFDGSRTAFLLVLLGMLYLVSVLRRDSYGRAKRAWLALAVAAVAGFYLVSASSTLLVPQAGGFSVPDPKGGWKRFGFLVQATRRGSEGLMEADPARFAAVEEALAKIGKHPLLGTGIGTTRTETIAEPMKVHVSYLQVWADLGLLAFLAYVWLMLGWTARAPGALSKIRQLPRATDRALHYNAIFLLIVYAVSGFFHPISTEWSEWIVFIIAYALLWEILHRKPLETPNG